MRKFVVFILSLLLAMNCVAVNAFAADSTAPTIDARLDLVGVNGSSPTSNVTVYAGNSFNVSFIIDTAVTGGRYTAAISGSGFSMDGTSAIRTGANYNGETISIPVRSDAELSTGRYPVVLSVEYVTDKGTASLSYTININVVGYTEPELPTYPEIAGAVDLTINAAPNSEVSAGSTFDVVFTTALSNIYSTWGYGYNNAKGTVTVSGDGFSLAGALAEENISVGRNSVTVLCENNAPAGRRQVTLTVAYVVDGETYTASRTLNIDVIAEEEEEELDESKDKASFSLVSASIPEGKGRSNLSTKLQLSFKNKTNFEAKNLKIRIVSLGDLILNTYTDTAEAGNIAGGQSVNATFPIKFPEYPSAQTSVTFELTYDSAAGPQTETVNVYLQATEKEKKEEEAPSIDASLKPKVIVKSYNVDVESVVSGEEFTLTIVLENTSNKKDLENMTVKVTPGANYSSSGSGSSSGPVFSLIDGTSSFYTDFFERNGTKEYTIRMKCSSSAGAGSYPIDIDFDFQYERDGGGGYDAGSDSLSINLPVEQPVKFELMEWEPPTECGPDGTMISFQYFNKSRNPMSALSISVEGDFEMPTQYVGSLGASSYDFFNGTITPVDPSAVGETKTAILVFTFTDAADNEKRIEYPFDVTITETSGMGGDMWGGDDMMWGGDGFDFPDYGFEDPMFGPDGMPVDGEGAEGTGLPLWAKIAIPVGAVVVLGIVAGVVVKKVKAKRDEEDEED